ncbi:MAG: glycosyltransferase family 2 protein [Proteobacteria bacterium]|nr:glycosyltransferase family 2 protein [Pseudomonadota bacterium]
MSEDIEVSVVIPTLNEEITIGHCVEKAIRAFEKLGIRGEVIVSDSYSKDRTVEIAQSKGARVVYQPLRGYGNAYHKGIAEARGKIIIIGDADNTYDFSDIEKFITPLRKGECDLVIGNRLNDTIEEGAMPWLHRYIGTPIMTWVLNKLFKTNISDCNCGMRSFTKEAYYKMNLKSPGWEYASEMVIKAGLVGLRIKEVDITLHRDMEGRKPHLNPWKAAWNNFKLMFMFSARYLFLIPGLVMFFLGLSIFIPLILSGENSLIWIGRIGLGNLSLVGSAFLILLGFQLIFFAIFMRVYIFYHRLNYIDKKLKFFLGSPIFKTETGAIISLIAFIIGVILLLITFLRWELAGFSQDPKSFRIFITGCLFTFMAIQVFFSYFVLNIFLDEIRYNLGTEGTESYRK